MPVVIGDGALINIVFVLNDGTNVEAHQGMEAPSMRINIYTLWSKII